MTIDDNIDFLNEAKKFYEEIANNPSLNETIKTHFTIEALENAIDIMRKYQKMKADYEERLKADLVAMVLEIQTEIDELPRYRMTNHGICIYRGMEEYRSDVNNVIKKVIDGLREESEEEK